MIPQGSILANVTLRRTKQPGRTYALDIPGLGMEGQGMIDGREAVRQMVFKILHTERYDHAIYSFNYGSELRLLLGGDPMLVRSELARRVKEALLQDDRIRAVEDIRMELGEHQAVISFTVESEYGSIAISKEVNRFV
ncbi:Protein of unknown function [Paenibacillus sp. UNCCL117]|uniref:DUF2634 domain-containing protein n=1 Tax=unclassified Paenibacillus TaxID=185978 RepID=UPI0008853BCE|nr:MULTISPECIES: DUF2634 domain-containing protein [unclassified Paenibacillus]SDD75625.1 Protein of unknown function [Paenibacillus sp. cl123]SFW52223.1 Protein of unknown function [Paenibacillus sp. UNCCL117]